MAEKVSLHHLARIMSHSSLDTTMLYLQSTPEDLQQAVQQSAHELYNLTGEEIKVVEEGARLQFVS